MKEVQGFHLHRRRLRRHEKGKRAVQISLSSHREGLGLPSLRRSGCIVNWAPIIFLQFITLMPPVSASFNLLNKTAGGYQAADGLLVVLFVVVPFFVILTFLWLSGPPCRHVSVSDSYHVIIIVSLSYLLSLEKDWILELIINPKSEPRKFASDSKTSRRIGIIFSLMGLPDLDRTNIRYGDTQSSSTISRWHPGNAGMGTQHFAEPSLTTRPFFQPTIEGSINNKNKQDGNNPMGSSSQNTDSSSSEDIDLELRLSL
ncbi:UNVERIFIED_CONTAM: hypothetical protein Sradi_5443900 [Sesamum radiatum]|uniref:Uncharacterized protein n=1 Tax=Sesamum radiatum TaxID=300843 RepID=A0AAW2LAK4_SESRA